VTGGLEGRAIGDEALTPRSKCLDARARRTAPSSSLTRVRLMLCQAPRVDAIPPGLLLASTHNGKSLSGSAVVFDAQTLAIAAVLDRVGP
jgi:hypothetical protein